MPSTSKCPKGWAEFRGECLLFSPEKKNWFEAHVSFYKVYININRMIGCHVFYAFMGLRTDSCCLLN